MPDAPQDRDPAEPGPAQAAGQPRDKDSSELADDYRGTELPPLPGGDRDTARAAPAGSGRTADSPAPGSGRAPSGRAASGLKRAWQGARAWRGARPFWAGIFLILAGAEILVIPLPKHFMGLILHIGTGGVLGILIGALLITCALLLWFSPAQRVFYSVAAVLLAIIALIATNLGGFIIGTLFGVLGGSLGFAWTPVDPAAEPAGPRDWPWRRRPGRHADPSAGLTLVLGRSPSPEREAADSAADSRAPDDGPPATGTSQGGSIYRGIPLLPLLLGLVAAVAHPAAASSLAPRPSCSPAPVTASARPHPTRTPQPAASATPASTCGTASPSPTGSPTSSPSPSPSASPGPTTSPRPTPSLSPTRKKRRKATVSGGLVVAAVPSTISAGSATLTGLSYDGVANVPTASGAVQMLKFSMSGLSLSGNDDLTVTEGGHTLAVRAASLDFSGNVTLLTTKFSGDLLGIPLTFTPSSPPPLVLPTMVFTNVVSERPYTSADALQIGSLQITSG